MREYLLANGWQTLWNEDYWIKKEWWNDPSLNVDTCGLDTKTAYEICKREKLMGDILPQFSS